MVSPVGHVSERKDQLGKLSFDKDDPLALSFVSAASNIRMSIFGIPLQVSNRLRDPLSR
jgi:hypothetical protein